MRTTTIPALIAVAIIISTGACGAPSKKTTMSPTAEQAPSTAAPAVRSGYAEVHGLRYYYEIHGAGEPLLLLHGGLMSIGALGPVLPALAKSRQVIAVDLHGHGRTALGDRAISLRDMGDDLAALLDELGYAQVDAVGYSMGAGVAIRLAVQHPTKVRRLIAVSAVFARDGYYPELLPMQAQVGAGMAEMMKETPMYTSYVAVAPNPAEFPTLLDRVGELMRTPYDWSEDVKTLSMPVMLVYGDSDMIRLDHVVAFYRLLGGGLRDAGWGREHLAKNRLAILPDATHYDVLEAPALVPTVLRFLDGGA